jgi:hypothetical protein
LPEAQPAVAAYLACGTQWRAGFSGRTGLDYPACLAVIRLRLPQWRRDWPDCAQ